MNKPMKWLTILALWLVAMVAHAGTHHHYYTDPQGTVLAKTDAQGNVIATYDYAPYGQAVASMSGAPDGPGYTGHVNDPETGFVYMQARYYDPAVGRFLSVDPVGPQSGNIFNISRFTYVSNNPVMLLDPTGMSPRSGKDMEICDGPVPCDEGGPARLLATSPFSKDRDSLLGILVHRDDPKKFMVIGKYRDPDCRECYEVWMYQLTTESGKILNDNGYSVEEHITSILRTGTSRPKTSEGSFIGMRNGVAFDAVGLTPRDYVELRSADAGTAIFRQTFTINYQGQQFPLTTIFYHKIAWANLGVSTTTQVARP